MSPGPLPAGEILIDGLSVLYPAKFRDPGLRTIRKFGGDNEAISIGDDRGRGLSIGKHPDRVCGREVEHF
jgi:hypothetical protein